ncbi:hypothetical protein T03_330 [Trichinella britovi]|uniref:Uncharacterized protein n=1 Tax=Trichinella britovi TaxID=45882 RepID=A0A0V1CCN2_TRIBR|nr:hypothetical protein T03_330 [Trichinella britovi]
MHAVLRRHSIKTAVNVQMNPLMDSWGIFVRSTEHRKVKIYVVGLLGWAPPHFRKPRVKSWNSKNSVHDGIKVYY